MNKIMEEIFIKANDENQNFIDIKIFPLLRIIEKIKIHGDYRSYHFASKQMLFFYEWDITVCGYNARLIKDDTVSKPNNVDYYRLNGSDWEIFFAWERRTLFNYSYYFSTLGGCHGNINYLKIKNYEGYKTFMSLMMLFYNISEE